MPSVTILTGSDHIDIDWETLYSDTEALTVVAPAVQAETLTFKGSLDNAQFDVIADSTATAIKGPAAGQLIIYNGIFSGLKTLRLQLSGNAAVDHIYQLAKAWRGI